MLRSDNTELQHITEMLSMVLKDLLLHAHCCHELLETKVCVSYDVPYGRVIIYCYGREKTSMTSSPIAITNHPNVRLYQPLKHK